MRKKRFFKDGKTVPPHRPKSERKRHNPPSIGTDAGINVRSQYEKTAIGFFQKYQIRFQYEPLVLLGGKQYRPDFFLPDYNLFVEICGYNHMPHYRDRQSYKEELYRKNNVKALFIYYNGKGSLESLLKDELGKAGAAFHPSADD